MIEEYSRPVKTRVPNDIMMDVIVKVEKIDIKEIPFKVDFSNDIKQRTEKSDSMKSTAEKSVKKNVEVLSQNDASRRSAIVLLKNTTLCPFKYDRSYMCNYCTEKFVKMSHLESHTKMQHDSLDVDDLRKLLSRKAKTQLIKVNVSNFGCKLCYKELEDFEKLKHHLVGKHRVELDLENDGVMLFRITDDDCQCVFCNERYDSYTKLITHLKKHYRQFHCDICGTGFVAADRLKMHMRLHNNETYLCNICGKMYKSEIRYRSHYQTVHLKKSRRICNYCPEIFKGSYQKTKHMANVHGVRINSYKCSYCSMSFIFKSLKKSHEQMKHVKLNTYTCDTCGFATSYRRTLKTHMICHSDKKDFKCKVCGNGYARKYTLKKHMRIHSDDRKFHCHYCEKKFVEKCSLKLHLNTYHKDVSVSNIEANLLNPFNVNVVPVNQDSAVLP